MNSKWAPIVTLTGVLAVMLLVGAHSVWAMVVWMLVVAPPPRYLLCLAGMSLIRAYVVRQVRPNAGQLPDAGGVSDPDAPWRQWLEASR